MVVVGQAVNIAVQIFPTPIEFDNPHLAETPLPKIMYLAFVIKERGKKITVKKMLFPQLL